MMRLTRLGAGAAAMAALTLAAAASSGNNLLYLVFGAQVAALLLSAAGGAGLRAVRAELEAPDQVFRDDAFPLKVRLRGGGAFGAAAVWAVCRGEAAAAERLASGDVVEFSFRYRCARRGVGAIDDVSLVSTFPFGLVRHARRVPAATILVLPRPREVHSPGELEAGVATEGKALLRKGRTGDLYGIREHRPEEDASRINWKLTAKTGRPLVLEFAESSGSRVTVRVDGPSGGDAERRIDEAASACRYYIDAGCEVRLSTPEAEVDYGKGLLHLGLLLRTLALLGAGKEPLPSAPVAAAPGCPDGDAAALRRLLLVGAALILGSLFLIEEIPPHALWALLLLVPAGAAVQEREIRLLPAWAWTPASLGVFGFVVLFDWRASGVVLANTHLILYLVANRLLNPLRKEELGQFFLIEFLAFFLVSGQTISLWYFLFFLLYFGFAGAWLGVATGLTPSRWRRWAPALGAAVFSGLLLAAGVFAAMPRLESRYRTNALVAAMGLDKLQVQASSVAGFTDNVSLGFFGRLKKSTARVMRVQPEGARASAVAPPALHIRGPAFDRFDGRRWTRTGAHFRYLGEGGRLYQDSNGRAWLPRRGGELRFPGTPSPTEARMTYSLYPMNAAVIFSAGGLQAVEGKDLVGYFDATDSAFFAAPYLSGTQYQAISDPEGVGYGARIADYDVLLRDLYLQVPEGLSPAVRDLAARIMGDKTGGRDKALAVQAYLRRSYDYSTFSANARTSLEDFLFKVRAGNCEYFATAGAVLLRLAGIPSRLVTGFLAQDWNEYGLFYDVRQSDAHAWVEAYVDGRWMTLDPTPGESRFPYSVRTLAARMSRWFDSVQGQWYARVIGYDSYEQRNTFHRIGLGVSRTLLRRLAAWASALAGAALAIWGARRRRRGRGAPRGPQGYYPIAQAALGRAGFRREPHWTPREFARWVAARRPDLAAIAPLAELHYVERYGPRPLSREESEEGRRLLGQLRGQL